jgi:hypothetical protein
MMDKETRDFLHVALVIIFTILLLINTIAGSLYFWVKWLP